MLILRQKYFYFCTPRLKTPRPCITITLRGFFVEIWLVVMGNPLAPHPRRFSSKKSWWPNTVPNTSLIEFLSHFIVNPLNKKLWYFNISEQKLVVNTFSREEGRNSDNLKCQKVFIAWQFATQSTIKWIKYCLNWCSGETKGNLQSTVQFQSSSILTVNYRAS